MDPARVMGTFLRVWRQEWARLSRAQLAIAVQAQCGGKQRVTRHTIEAWEEGQPPHSSEELEALLAVMRRHGITEWEAEDVRRTVYVACASRQYPALFPDEDIAYREDVFELTTGLSRAGDPHDPNIAVLVGTLSQVDGALRSRGAPKVSRAQRQRQAAARAWLRSVVGNHHQEAARSELAAGEHERNAAELLVELGPAGLGQRISVLDQRTAAAHDRLVGAHLSGDKVAGMAQGRALVRLHEEAQAAGDSHAALYALCVALDAPLPPAELAPLVERAERSLGTWERSIVLRVPYPLLYMARGAARAGQLTRSEGYLARVRDLGDLSPAERLVVHNVAGSIGLSRGARGEAEEHFREALGIGRQMRVVCAVRELERSIEACERGPNGTRKTSIPK